MANRAHKASADTQPPGDEPGPESPNEPVPSRKPGPKVSDPHPDTEAGYDRKSKVPVTGL